MIKLNLSQEDIKKFKTDGYLIIENFIDSHFVAKIKARFNPIFKGRFETGIEPDEWNWKEGRDDNDLTRQSAMHGKMTKL